MAPRKQWTQRLTLTLPDGAKERIDAVLRFDEDRNDLIRKALDREIERRRRRRLRGSDDAIVLLNLKC